MLNENLRQTFGKRCCARYTFGKTFGTLIYKCRMPKVGFSGFGGEVRQTFGKQGDLRLDAAYVAAASTQTPSPCADVS